MYSWLKTGSLKTKIGNVYSLEYIEFSKVFFTSHTDAHCLTLSLKKYKNGN
jgi:hypothetical protein